MEKKTIHWTDEQWERRDKLAEILYTDDPVSFIFLNWVEEDDELDKDDNRLTWVQYSSVEDKSFILETLDKYGFKVIDEAEILGLNYLYIIEKWNIK